MRYEDLPAAARAQVDAKLGRKPKAAKGAGQVGGPCPYTCKACGRDSATWPEAERHAIKEGHVRQEMVLGG